MSRSAANAIMSRKMSASGAFSTSVRRFIISSVIGGSSVAFAIRNPNPNRRIANGRRKPLARYGAMGSALRERLAPSELHHQLGHDRLIPSFSPCEAGAAAFGRRARRLSSSVSHYATVLVFCQVIQKENFWPLNDRAVQAARSPSPGPTPSGGLNTPAAQKRPLADPEQFRQACGLARRHDGKSPSMNGA